MFCRRYLHFLFISRENSIRLTYVSIDAWFFPHVCNWQWRALIVDANLKSESRRDPFQKWNNWLRSIFLWVTIDHFLWDLHRNPNIWTYSWRLKIAFTSQRSVILQFVLKHIRLRFVFDIFIFWSAYKKNQTPNWLWQCIDQSFLCCFPTKMPLKCARTATTKQQYQQKLKQPGANHQHKRFFICFSNGFHFV